MRTRVRRTIALGLIKKLRSKHQERVVKNTAHVRFIIYS